MEEESESVGIMMMKINDEGKRISGRTDNLEQASICTEWEQSSMVLNPCSQVGATVTTSHPSISHFRSGRVHSP